MCHVDHATLDLEKGQIVLEPDKQAIKDFEAAVKGLRNYVPTKEAQRLMKIAVRNWFDDETTDKLNPLPF